MRRTIPVVFISTVLMWLVFPISGHTLPGDADGNGTVNLEDARTIARFLVNQIPILPNPADADATQDGKVDMEDAFIIVRQLTGQSAVASSNLTIRSSRDRCAASAESRKIVTLPWPRSGPA